MSGFRFRIGHYFAAAATLTPLPPHPAAQPATFSLPAVGVSHLCYSRRLLLRVSHCLGHCLFLKVLQSL